MTYQEILPWSAGAAAATTSPPSCGPSSPAPASPPAGPPLRASHELLPCFDRKCRSRRAARPGNDFLPPHPDGDPAYRRPGRRRRHGRPRPFRPRRQRPDRADGGRRTAARHLAGVFLWEHRSRSHRREVVLPSWVNGFKIRAMIGISSSPTAATARPWSRTPATCSTSGRRWSTQLGVSAQDDPLDLLPWPARWSIRRRRRRCCCSPTSMGASPRQPHHEAPRTGAGGRPGRVNPAPCSCAPSPTGKRAFETLIGWAVGGQGTACSTS